MTDDPAGADGVLLVERDEHILILTLNRPQARNAVNSELASRLGQALEDFSADSELRVAILRGAGSAFCAGQDLKAFAAGEPVVPTDRPDWGFAGFVSHFTDKPVIAAVHGFAFGGGLELALACDLVVAAAGTRIGLPEVTRGLFAAGGGVPRIGQQLPFKVAMRLVLTGEPMSVEEAERWGLINAVVPEGELMQNALSIARTIAANAPLSVQATKRIMYANANDSVWDQQTWPPILQEFDAVFSSDDAKEGAAAFVEKRPPVWTGQ